MLMFWLALGLALLALATWGIVLVGSRPAVDWHRRHAWSA